MLKLHKAYKFDNARHRMNCELCGKEAVGKARVEGVELHICAACGKFGTMFTPPKSNVQNANAHKPEIIHSIVEDAGELVRKAREKKGITQKDFALSINEHQSVLHHIETGRHEPSLELARKLEKTLHLKLVEEETSVAITTKNTPTGPTTIGDLIKIK